LETSGKSDT